MIGAFCLTDFRCRTSSGIATTEVRKPLSLPGRALIQASPFRRGALLAQRALKLGQRREQMDLQPARRGRRVDRLGQRSKRDAPFAKLGEHSQQMPRYGRGDPTATRSACRHRRGASGKRRPHVLEDALGASDLKRVELQSEVLAAGERHVMTAMISCRPSAGSAGYCSPLRGGRPW